jgi:hypothetical protein
MNYFLTLIVVSSISFSGLSQAENGSDYSKVVSVGGNGVTVRDTENNWFYGADYSLTERDSDFSSSETSHSLSGIIGHRVYLNNDEIRSFVDGAFKLSHTFSDSDFTSYKVSGAYGIERFISKEMSVEASIGIALSHDDAESDNFTRVSGPLGRLSMSYYFN